MTRIQSGEERLPGRYRPGLSQELCRFFLRLSAPQHANSMQAIETSALSENTSNHRQPNPMPRRRSRRNLPGEPLSRADRAVILTAIGVAIFVLVWGLASIASAAFQLAGGI